MRRAVSLLPWLALACLIADTCGAAASVGMVSSGDADSSSSSGSSSSRGLLQAVSTQGSPSCVCPMNYEPVCGKDGNTHGNHCSAKCKGIQVAYVGECQTSKVHTLSHRPRCSCAKMYAPVCSKDKKTYSSACEAKCAGAEVEMQGPCPGSSTGSLSSTGSSEPVACKCDTSVKEVCGENGKTFTNECLAACAGTKVVSQGACKTSQPTCVCTADYDPVCGSNGKTYSNACEANCEGVAIAVKGMCQVPAAARAQAAPSGPVSGSCVCPAVYNPVCTKNGKTRGNKCEAKCRGETVEREGECENPVAVSSETSKASPQAHQVTTKASLSAESATTEDAANLPGAGIPMKPERRPNCACMALYAPVCGKDGNTYSNKCEAGCHNMQVAREGECDSGSVGDIVDGAINTGAVTSVRRCNVCPAIFAPVCGKDGKTYGNDCEAVCRGRTTVAYHGKCKGAGVEHTGISGLDRCLEACPGGGKPVCGLDRKRYRSACAANCHKVDIAYPGDCKGECSACPHQWYPYCANSAQYGPSTFANCCYAKCNNVAIIKQVLHAGICLDKCHKCDPTLERPLCCKGRTYKNGCFAKCNEEDTSQCSLGRCSTTAHVEQGLGCLLGPCNVQCSADKYDKPVCGSDGLTYPSQCSLMCSQHVAIVHQGKCGTCAPNQLPGGFPFCEHSDRQGVSPVCGSDGVIYRNGLAATAAKVTVVANSTCAAKQCGAENEVCFLTGSPQSTCCSGYTCMPDTSVRLEASVALKVAGSKPGVCRKASATLSA